MGNFKKLHANDSPIDASDITQSMFASNTLKEIQDARLKLSLGSVRAF